MRKTILLPGGEELPALGQGTWYLGDAREKRAEEIRALQTGIELGLSCIDTAEMYGNGRSELLVGEAIAGRRDKVFLVSKVLPSNASRKGTKAACENSLSRLKTSVLDLYLLHWQGRYPFEETVAAMLELKAEGKIRYWGVSNMDTAEMEAFFSLPGGDSCAVNQVLYNVSRRGVEFDLLPWCAEKKLPVMAYSPVEQGRILGERTLRNIAAAHGASAAQVALAWVLRKPGILAIPKAGKAKHVEENAKSLDLRLSDAELALIDAAFPPPHSKMHLEML
jgi:diketogulonate reductase-like aldo/keto reductase